MTESINLPKKTVIWVMDSDICGCGGLIDDWGFCTWCGSDGIDYDEEEYIAEDWEGFDEP